MFARNGIDNTSVRAIAAAAGIDPALVHHYFGTKRQLFTATIRMPIDPAELLEPLRDTPVAELGRALPAVLVPLWDSERGSGLIVTMKSILGGPDVGLLRTFLDEVITAEIAPRVDRPAGTGRIRVQFVVTQLVGLAVARYLVGLEPLASLPAERIADTLGPTLQRYLTGELDSPSARAAPQ